MATPAPTFDTGLVADVDTALTVKSAVTTLYLLGARFSNTTDDPITIILTNTAGGELIPTKIVPPHDSMSVSDFNWQPTVGLKWQASAVGLDGQVWGYTSWPF